METANEKICKELSTVTNTHASDIGTDYSETLREAKVSELILVVLHFVG